MFDIFSYTFFQNAVIGIMLVSIASAIIGTYVVCRRMVFVTGGITHASFGGLGLGFSSGSIIPQDSNDRYGGVCVRGVFK